MKIDVQIDTKNLLLRMRNGPKRLVYATVNSLNASARDFQPAMEQQVRREFVVRKDQFLFGSPTRPGGAAARIGPFASVGRDRPYVEIAVRAPTTEASRRLLLGTFEAGGPRKPMTPGAESVAVPLLGRPARPSIKRGVPPQYTFQGLRFQAYRAGKRLRRRTTRSGGVSTFGEFGRLALPQATPGRGGLQWKGRERTFILTKTAKEPHGGVFQRIGKQKGDIRLIYAFRRNLRLDARLGFHATARRVLPARFREHMERETLKALARHGAPA